MSEREWPPVEPILGTDDPKPFPAEALPGWLGRYVRAEAVAKQVPVDMTGMLALGVVSAALQGRLSAQHGSWVEPMTFYTAIIMNSGERKSSVFSSLTAPLKDLEDEIRDRERSLIAENVQDESRLQRRLDQKRKQISRQEQFLDKLKLDPEVTTETLNKERGVLDTYEAEERDLLEEQERFVKLHYTQILSSDLTPEACAKMLSEQRHSALAVMSSEGGVFDVLSGRRYSSESNLDVFLKGHSGDELKVNRVNRDPEIVRRAILTLGLMIQPNVLEDLGSKKEMVGRGLLARFAYSMPQSLLGRREQRPEPVTDAIREEYRQSILEIGKAAYDADEVVIARLTDEAADALDAFERWVEPMFLTGHDDLGDLGDMHDWMGKFVGLIFRVAGLFAAARVRSLPTVIEEDDVNSAVSMADYFLDHTYRAYSLMGQVPDASLQRQMLMFLKKKGLREFRTSELQQQWSVAKALKAERIDEVLQGLADRHYVAQITTNAKPLRYKWEVNPAVYGLDEGDLVAPVLIEEAAHAGA